MIKTLQITSILAAILAVILLVSSVVFGVQKDERIEKFLDSPGVKELFAKVAGGAVKGRVGQSSPLVDKAQLFASIINPPVKLRPKVPVTRKQVPTIRRPEGPVTPKFPLIGTCFYESHPEQSLAFINEPGKGLHWVKQGSSVGHLIIEQIKDGIIVVRDGQRTFEMLAEVKPITTSLLEGAQLTPAAGIGSSSTAALPPAVPGRRPPGNVPPRPVTRRSPSRTQPIGGESTRMEALDARLKDIQKTSMPGKAEPGLSAAEAAAEKAALEIMRKLLSDERIEPEEAKKLDELGKDLKGNQEDPNRPKGGSKIQPIPPRPSRPVRK